MRQAGLLGESAFEFEDDVLCHCLRRWPWLDGFDLCPNLRCEAPTVIRMRRVAVVIAVVLAAIAGAGVGFMLGARHDGMPDAVRRLCSTFIHLDTQAWEDADEWTREHPDAAHPASPPDVWTIGKQAALERAVSKVSIVSVPREWRAVPIAVSNLSLTMAAASNPEAEPVSRVDQQDSFITAEAACAGRS